MNFVMDLAHRRVFCGLVVEHRSAEFEGLRFDSSWDSEFFLSLFLYRAQNLPSLLFHTEIRMFSCRASFVNRAGMTAPVQFTRAGIVGGTVSIRKSDSYCEMNYFS